MFCKNCGVKLEDGTKFCTECGTPTNGSCPRIQGGNTQQKFKNVANTIIDKVNSMFTALNQMMPENIRKKISAQAICGLALVAVVAILIISNISGGYKGVVDKVYKSLKNTDGKLYYSIMADDYIQDCIEDWHYTKDDLIEKYQNNMETQLNKIKADCGDDVKIKYKITDTYQPTKEEIQHLNSYIKYYGFEENSVQDAIVAYTTMYANGSLGSCEYTRDILVLKVHGKWCITGGSIDLPWYSN